MFYYDFEDFLRCIFGTDMHCIIEAESILLLLLLFRARLLTLWF